MGKPEIRPPATPKPLNRSSPKFAHVITSETSAAVQTFVTIRQGVSFPENAILCIGNVYSASFLGSSDAPHPRPQNRFSREIRHTTQFSARMCLLGVSMVTDKF